MDVDATRRRGQQRTCYLCRQPGHMTRDCPRRDQIRAAGLPEDLLERIDLVGEIWTVSTEEEVEPVEAPIHEEDEEDFV